MSRDIEQKKDPMKAKEIQELIDYISNSGLAEVKIKTQEFELSIKKYADSAPVAVAAPAPIPAPAPAPVAAPVPAAAAPAPAPAATPSNLPADPVAVLRGKRVWPPPVR